MQPGRSFTEHPHALARRAPWLVVIRRRAGGIHGCDERVQQTRNMTVVALPSQSCKPHPDATPPMRRFEVHVVEVPSFEALVEDAMNMAGVRARWERWPTVLSSTPSEQFMAYFVMVGGPPKNGFRQLSSAMKGYGKPERIQEVWRVRSEAGSLQRQTLPIVAASVDICPLLLLIHSATLVGQTHLAYAAFGLRC